MLSLFTKKCRSTEVISLRHPNIYYRTELSWFSLFINVLFELPACVYIRVRQRLFKLLDLAVAYWVACQEQGLKLGQSFQRAYWQLSHYADIIYGQESDLQSGFCLRDGMFPVLILI